jgi:hypothetical protein
MHFDDRAEIYPVCFEANLKSSGSAVPTDTTTFPAAYEPENYKWLDYSVPWDSRPAADYVPPGPAVYTGGGSASSVPPASGSSAAPDADTSATGAITTSPSQTVSENQDVPVVTEVPDDGGAMASSTEESSVPTE